MNAAVSIDPRPPWPRDAVIVVAANAGEHNRDTMEAVVPVKCRDCGRALCACSYSIRVAENWPSRGRRPVKFMCLNCARKYQPVPVFNVPYPLAQR